MFAQKACPVAIKTNAGDATDLGENACHFVTNQSINTILVSMERGTFRLPAVGVWSRPLQWAGHDSTRKSVLLKKNIAFSTSFRAKTYLQENACHFITNQPINTILVPMERRAFRLPTVEIWSRPLQWVGHESTRKSDEPNWDSNSTWNKAGYMREICSQTEGC